MTAAFLQVAIISPGISLLQVLFHIMNVHVFVLFEAVILFSYCTGKQEYPNIQGK